jgi:pSer/pThr/pTyr-binding forkhead associated (FHA) protein/predicted  nucleic acid-binding Zn-ribbon protein
MAKLTFVLEDGQQIVVALAERITLGRADDNDIVVDDERISKRHAELVRNADGSVQVFDSDSTAGTFLNGERVRSGTALNGARLSFGPLEAVLDLEDHGLNGGTVSQFDGAQPNNSRIGPRKKGKGTRRNGSATDRATTLPPDELLARQQARLRDESVRLEEEKARLQSEEEARQRMTARREELARLESDKARLLTEIAAAREEFTAWQVAAEKERHALSTRVEALRSAEERLVPVNASVAQAEAAHGGWLKAIQDLSVQHDEKTASLQLVTSQIGQKALELQQLGQDEGVLRQEIDSLAAHRDQQLAHVQQLRDECATDEAVLADLRQKLADLEQRCQEKVELAEAREDQVKTAERKLEGFAQRRTQLEAHIKELSGTEERLEQALARLHEAESRHTELAAAITTLTQEHQRAETTARDAAARVDALQKHHEQLTTATEEARGMHQTVEASLQRSRDQLAACETNLAAESKTPAAGRDTPQGAGAAL